METQQNNLVPKSEDKPKAFFPKKKKKGRKTLWILVGICVLVAGLFLLPKTSKPTFFVDLSDTTVLSYTDLRSTVSASGIVESAHSTTVYSTMAYPVKAVHVEVGDFVSEGTLLAELDDQTILDQISSQEVSRETASANNASQVNAAQDNYDNFKYGLENGLNTTLNNAQIQVDNALRAYEQAQLSYDRYAEGLRAGENTTLLNAESGLRAAENALDSARDTYDQLWDSVDDAKDALKQAQQELTQAEAQLEQLLLEKEALEAQDPLPAEQLQSLNGQIDQLKLQLSQLSAARDTAEQAYGTLDGQLDSAQSALSQAEYNYDTQISVYHAAMTSTDQTLADLLTSVDTAKKSYDDALVALASANKSTQDQLETYRNNLTTAQNSHATASVDESLRQLQVDLQDTKITSPVSGTVTAVYAEVGASGSGLLFVIEDTENMIVDTAIKGYDMGSVTQGIPVIITSDATGEDELDGLLTTIAPTANKTAMGTTDTSTDALFAAEVQVLSASTVLRIGMEVQLDFVIDSAEHVLTVPYDAVYSNDLGQSCVISLTEQENEEYLLQELVVTAGTNDDLDIAISGDGVTEDLRILNDPATYLTYIGQSLPVGTNPVNLFGAMPMMGG